MSIPSSDSFNNGRFLKRLQFRETPSPASSPTESLPRPHFDVYIGIPLAFLFASLILYLLINSVRNCHRRRTRLPDNCGSTHREADGFSFIPERILDGSRETPVNDDCVVCLSEFEEGETIRELPKCGHVFHKDCLDKWLHSNCPAAPLCPICRARVIEGGERKKTGVQQRDDGTEGIGIIPLPMLASHMHHPSFM